MAFISLRKVR
ncbi:hypothetical protein VTL71DRAFT_3848 [Oculimacula yallundae]|uniref:Uncharacterized protein n=1 Tax=Oculimacula yallundae TaxID=86028 RepID=A0ABR4C446_9HELO